jgi:hypothetical protein
LACVWCEIRSCGEKKKEKKELSTTRRKEKRTVLYIYYIGLVVEVVVLLGVVACLTLFSLGYLLCSQLTSVFPIFFFLLPCEHHGAPKWKISSRQWTLVALQSIHSSSSFFLFLDFPFLCVEMCDGRGLQVSTVYFIDIYKVSHPRPPQSGATM